MPSIFQMEKKIHLNVNVSFFPFAKVSTPICSQLEEAKEGMKWPPF